ncbi:MAG: mechanosensitive ion channel family protein [Spirulinaceae cyanobacterium]
MNFSLHSFLFAQSSQDAAKETADNAKELIAEITTGKITQALLILIIAYGLLFITDKLINWFSEQVDREWRLRIKQSLPFWRMVIFIVAISMLMNLFFNLSRSNLLALTGTIAVALGFAFKDYASSVIAGLIGLFEAPYQVGDRIQIGEHYGEVMSYGLRGLRLRTPEDNMVTIPHNTIWTEPISNANAGELEAQVVTHFYLDYYVDVQLVMGILYRVAYTSKYTQLKLPILVLVEEKPWATRFELKSYPMDAREEFIYKTDLIKRAKQAFKKNNLSYPKLLPADVDV